MVFYLITKNILGVMEEQIIDIRIARALQDCAFVLMSLQLVALAISFIRATGFDVRSFNFAQDLEDLQIEEKDREEFELTFNIDYDLLKRKIRGSLRNLKYFYKAYQKIINISIVAIVAILALSITIKTIQNNKLYTTNEAINVGQFNIMVLTAYKTNNNYHLKTITKEGTSLLVIKIAVKKNYGIEPTLNTARMMVKIGDQTYYATIAYKDSLIDLGTTYNKQVITDTYTTYLLTFEVPSVVTKTPEFDYITLGNKTMRVKLDYLDLDGDETVIAGDLGELMDLTKTIYETGYFNLFAIDLANQFEVNYDFCLTTCYPSIEYIKPNINLASLAAVMYLDYDTSDDISDFMTFLNTYGVIQYTINDETKTTMSFTQITTKHADGLYVTINSEVLKATSVKLLFRVRNYTYTYVIK